MIFVECRECHQRTYEDELKDEDVTNIEEDIRGYDVLSFVCPKCGKETRSHRYGSA